MTDTILTTAEVAAYLRLKERTIYELVRSRRIPCTRIGGKWLFPRALIDRWLVENTEYGKGQNAAVRPPPILAGSHDPLLEWALRRSRSGLATMTAGSLDGLDALREGGALLAALHIVDPDTGDFNVPALQTALPAHGIVAVVWAWRQQGLLVPHGNPMRLHRLSDLRRRRARVVLRQPQAGSHVLFMHLLAEAGIRLDSLKVIETLALNETEIAAAVREGRADAGFGVEASAGQLGVDFVPLFRERFDLAMRQRDYFEAPVQRLLEFARGEAFAAHAERLGGYDLREFGRVVLNQ
ncbi:MAG: helix-turn-helix domain-containing protein [Alphaproteobacteria bacterium]|nr:helix-turn-helix domain-containing protein [Alphaproteobacteria bacterium]